MRRLMLGVGMALILSAATCQTMRRYTHPTLGFSVETPANWTPDTSDPEFAVGFETPEESSLYLGVTTESAFMTFATDSSYRDAMANFSPGFQEGVAEYLEIDPAQVAEVNRQIHEVRGLKVATLDFRAPAPDDWVFYARVRLVIADGKLYALILSGDEEEFKQNEPLMNQILDSFEPKNRASGQFPVRLLMIALGVACLSGVLMLGGILLLVRKLTGRL